MRSVVEISHSCDGLLDRIQVDVECAFHQQALDRRRIDIRPRCDRLHGVWAFLEQPYQLSQTQGILPGQARGCDLR